MWRILFQTILWVFLYSKFMYTLFFIFQDHHPKLYSWLQFVKIKVSVVMFCQHHPPMSKLLGLQGWHLMVLLCSSVAFHFQQSHFKHSTSGSQKFKKTFLFAHNCRKFDSIILCIAITKCNFYLLNECISGLCDTLLMLKEHISTKTTSFSLETLVRNILECTYNHIMHMMKNLQKLIEHSSICIDAYYLNYSFTTSYIMSVIKQMENTKSNLQLIHRQSCIG